MQIAVSLYDKTSDNNRIIFAIIENDEIVNSIDLQSTRDWFYDDKLKSGVSGITWYGDNLFLASRQNIIRTSFNLDDFEPLSEHRLGFDIHQIDWIPDGIVYCDTGRNAVRIIQDGKVSLYHNGIGSKNHINSVYITDDAGYIVYHNNVRKVLLLHRMDI